MYLPQCEFSGQKEGRKEGEEEGDSDNIFLEFYQLIKKKKNRSRKLDGKDKMQRKRGDKRFLKVIMKFWLASEM